MAAVNLTRRGILQAGLGAVAVALLPRGASALPVSYQLTAKRVAKTLPGCVGPSDLWLYDDGRNETLPIVLRAARGENFTAALKNELAEHTAIHWHGVRVPFAMDGVPYITQPPVRPGESFEYSFAPPDPGTFFFHPHCNTVEALGRGLAGVLVVDDPRDQGLFDVEHVIALKDWRVQHDGGFEDFLTDAGAAKAGSFGALRTANGMVTPSIMVPPGARVRLRILNLDSTRIPQLDLPGVKAVIVATDGNACAPFALQGWRLGPAMRADVAFIAPEKTGVAILLQDIFSTKPRVLARIVTAGEAMRSTKAVLRLPEADLPQPDLKAAQTLEFTLLAGNPDPALQAWAKQMGVSADEICLTQKVFWSINRQVWPGMGQGTGQGALPPPLAELKSGRSYIIELFNGTPHQHPMHLHGHTFRVLGSSERDLPPHWADTVLVRPKERVRIAFVAGQPGDWMMHCHIIEHQETGMMGYLRVA
ncbi:multicopper oxidase family protein [Ferrovibrio sp.]|uniref:multicopper oxidase family protein n=1 Tax=Ferrovibrio sp. TaxID=1917215 RepID=UPI002634295F|nr:multicopper oxidase family protein [Ferrovibrio sp.]